MGFDLYGERPTIKRRYCKNQKKLNWDTATQEEKRSNIGKAQR